MRERWQDTKGEQVLNESDGDGGGVYIDALINDTMTRRDHSIFGPRDLAMPPRYEGLE